VEGPGSELFAGACAVCHEPAGALYFSAQVDLNRSTSIEYADPRNVIHVILDGIEQPLTPSEPLMPGFATAFTDAQVAELAAYLREAYSDRPAWDDLEDAVANVREAQREAVTHFGVSAGDAIEESEE
jgi:nicotinate dehydrogenase subunit B